jgi:acetyltransferase
VKFVKIDNLDRLFNPRTVALIGASNRKGSVGHDIMRNILVSSFEGTLYPVNHVRESVQSVKCLKSIMDIKEELDLVIVATPARTVPEIVKQAGKKKVGGMVIISAGFKEAGEEGLKLFEEVKDIAKKNNIRIIGPNCLGFLRPSINLNASFATKMPKKGNIAFISQSGALCTAILDWAQANNVGFSYFVSVGSMADISYHDLIEYFDKDPNTNSILIYMESLSNAKAFLEASKKYTTKKPVIVLKVGRSSQGAHAAASHTGSLAGNDRSYDAAFKSAGIIRVNDSHELFDCAQILAMQKRPKGNRLAIITNAGGPGVISTDYLVKQNGVLANLSKKTLDALDKVLPNTWSHGNPVDVLGDANSARYKDAVGIIAKDKNVDGLLIILTPQSMTDCSKVSEEIVKLAKKYSNKMFLACWMGESAVFEGRKILDQNNVPVFRLPENAIRGFITLYKSTHMVENLPSKFDCIKHTKYNKKENINLISLLKKQKRKTMTEDESKRFLANYGILQAEHSIAKDLKSALKKAEKIGYPIAMKILSSDILHKTDVKGVIIDIKNETELKKEYGILMKNIKKYKPDAKIEGVFLEKMCSKRYELILGAKKDSIFGHIIVFGQGGTAVEIIKDTQVALPPLNCRVAHNLISGTKIYEQLKGFRGIKAIDMKELQRIICQFSDLLMDFPELLEVDINPLIVDENNNLIVLDAKIIIDLE